MDPCGKPAKGYFIVILTFADPEAERIWNSGRSRRLPPNIQPAARRKLRQLDAAGRLDDLRAPAGNRLEKLKGFTDPRYSIRINDQCRITFGWSNGGAVDVRIEDYHRG